jgi:hypothetical protein
MSVSVVSGRDANSPRLMPVKLHRGDREMILSYGSLPALARVSLRRAGLLVGTVLASRSPPSASLLGGCDYLFLGPAKAKEELFELALRDCSRSGWSRESDCGSSVKADTAIRRAGEMHMEVHDSPPSA